jgi:predicted permease
MTPSDRVFRALLALYPLEFRRRYGNAMADFHRDRVAAACAAGRSPIVVWIPIIADALISASAEHLVTVMPEKPTMRTLIADLSFALRSLRRRPAFTSIVVATIALGVGVNAAIFSVVSGILLRPLPYPHAEQVIAFGHEPPHWLASEPDFADYHRDMRTLSALAAFTKTEVTISSAGDPERLRFVRATEDFFPLLGVKPLIGRVFTADEYEGNPPTVVVISHSLWQRRFGGVRSILGSKILINGVPRTVVGVMPSRFDYPEARTDVWSPMPRFRPNAGDRTNHYLFMVGRLKSGVAVDEALLDATNIAKRVMHDYPQSFDPAKPLVPHMELARDQLVGSTRPYLLALLGAVGFVLLIACANVANLLLVRGESRRKEMALRGALGASGMRLLAHMLAESGLLAVGGGTLGLAFAWVGQRALLAAAPASVPRLDSIAIDWRVVAFTAAITGLTALFIGVVPARRAARGNAADTLRNGSRLATQHGTAGRARRALVAVEVMLAVVTLAGAGLLLRSLWNLQGASLGIDPRNVLTAKVTISAREYDDARATVFFDQLLERVRALPGVRAAAASGWLPVVDAGGLWGFQVEGRSYEETRWPLAVPQQVTPGYFGAVGMPLVAGRDFTSADRESSPFTVIVSRLLAETVFPGENPIGKRIRLGGQPYVTIVGIVGDLRSRGFGDTPEPSMYFPYPQTGKAAFFMPRTMALIVRTVGEPQAVAKSVRDAVHALDRAAPVSEVRTMEEVVGTSVANRRFTTALLAGFALLALLLAGIGIYGVISYGVSQRSGEIGVRMALGAEQSAVVSLVMSEALRMCAAGLVVGLGLSIIVGRLTRSMLVGVSFIDPITLGVACLALLIVAGLAAAVPARRAMRVSPSEALKV